ncbi:MAG TPA: hypothetical protein VGL53_09945 [Bryobacteraceae bacterium]|jgi:hypothetical protein
MVIDTGEAAPFLTLEHAGGAVTPIDLPGFRAVSVSGGSFAISDEGKVIVAVARRIGTRVRSLFAFESRNSAAVRDLTPFLAEFEPHEIETLSLAGHGLVAAVGSRERFQVLNTLDGATVFRGVGRFPRVSPDGVRLGFITDERLHVVNLEPRANITLLPGTKVMGIGGWSPDGKFLIGGAWTRLLAMEKRKVIIDAETGDYAQLGTLSEGDYGVYFRWASTMLMPQ